MNCGYCGKPFREDRSQKACKACPLGSDCGLILCPHCGYENPGLPRWIAFLRDRFRRKLEGPTSEGPTSQTLAQARRRRSLPVLDGPLEIEDRA